jgi:hypothetical protein
MRLTNYMLVDLLGMTVDAWIWMDNMGGVLGDPTGDLGWGWDE